MTCKQIMTAAPACLRTTNTVAEALSQMSATRSPILAVTDGSGHFRGVFGLKQALALALPSAVRLGIDLGELGYVTEGLESIRARLTPFIDKPIGKHVAQHGHVLPETSATEGLLQLERGDGFLPVVDSAGKLVGIITAEQAIGIILGDN